MQTPSKRSDPGDLQSPEVPPPRSRTTRTSKKVPWSPLPRPSFPVKDDIPCAMCGKEDCGVTKRKLAGVLEKLERLGEPFARAAESEYVCMGCNTKVQVRYTSRFGKQRSTKRKKKNWRHDTSAAKRHKAVESAPKPPESSKCVIVNDFVSSSKSCPEV